MASNVKEIVRANVRRMVGIAPGESGVSKVMALGFSNGTASRILDESTDIGVALLGRLAAALKLEPWQLCVPDLDPDQIPKIEPVQFRWPFRNIDPEVITSLVGVAAQNVENGLLSALATAGIAPRKRHAA